MRNFPHQVNRIWKVRGALQVAAQIITAHQDISDDGVFGYAVTRTGVYAFRGLSGATSHEIEQAIQREQLKPLSSQGPRTFARDLRRTLLLLGFLQQSPAMQWQLTSAGQQLLQVPDPPDPEASAIWVDAVRRLELAPSIGQQPTHPAVNMLRMVQRSPGIQKKWLGFALDMTNDSDEELARVLELQNTDFETALARTETTRYEADNAVKILPSFLEQLGLISIQHGVCELTEQGLQLINAGRGAPPAPDVIPPRRPRRGYRVSDSSDVSERPSVQGRSRTSEEQLHSTLLLEERTTEHQNLVKRVIDALNNVSNVRCSDDAFDIIADSTLQPELLLIEAKTVRDDGLVQARIALGQLLYYEYFDVLPIAEGRCIRRIVAFDCDPGTQARAFLSAYGVETIVAAAGEMDIPDQLSDYFGA